MENPKHLLASFGEELLSVSRIGHRFPLLGVTARKMRRSWVWRHIGRYILELDVPQVDIGNVPDKNPPNFEHTLPFVGCPHRATPSVIHL